MASNSGSRLIWHGRPACHCQRIQRSDEAMGMGDDDAPPPWQRGPGVARRVLLESSSQRVRDRGPGVAMGASAGKFELAQQVQRVEAEPISAADPFWDGLLGGSFTVGDLYAALTPQAVSLCLLSRRTPRTCISPPAQASCTFPGALLH